MSVPARSMAALHGFNDRRLGLCRSSVAANPDPARHGALAHERIRAIRGSKDIGNDENAAVSIIPNFKPHEGRKIGKGFLPHEALQFPERSPGILRRHARSVPAQADQKASAIRIGKGNDGLQRLFGNFIGILQMKVGIGARTYRLIQHEDPPGVLSTTFRLADRLFRRNSLREIRQFCGKYD